MSISRNKYVRFWADADDIQIEMRLCLSGSEGTVSKNANKLEVRMRDLGIIDEHGAGLVIGLVVG